MQQWRDAVIVKSLPLLLSTTLLAPTLHAQDASPDRLMRLAQAEAPGCRITGVHQIAGDTIVVSLVDSLLTAVAFDSGEWQLCDGAARQQTTRDVSRAILRPLWAAWGPKVRPTIGVVEIASLVVGDAYFRLAFPAPSPRP